MTSLSTSLDSRLQESTTPDLLAGEVSRAAARVATHCPYCAMQCGMHLEAKSAEIHVVPNPHFPTNRGGLCRKGWTSADLLRHPDRLLRPLIRDRKGGQLRPAEWEEALERIRAEIVSAQDTLGRDAVGVFGGGGLTNEKAYLLGKFARVALRTRNIDYNGRFCMSSAAAANNLAFGLDRGLPFPMQDIAKAGAILLVGSNLNETMPPIGQWFLEQQEAGGKLIVVDPRRTPTAESATLHLQNRPGTDLALANGLLQLAIRHKLVDEGFIAARTEGYDAVKVAAAGYWPERVERITGVSIESMTRTVFWLASAERAMVLTARGAEQHSKGTDTVLAWINLTLALGKAGRRGSGYGCLTGQGNGQGGREHGQKADQLPGYRKITDPAARAHLAKVWDVPVDDIPGPGVSAYEMLAQLGQPEGVHALFVFGSNPAVSNPNASLIRQRLGEIPFLCVADIFLSETAALADVVLPTTQWAEEDGTMTNLEGRVLRRKMATVAPGEVHSDNTMLHDIAELLGCGDKFPTEPHVIFDELRQASAGGPADYSGITYEQIERQSGVFWPCTAAQPDGTPYPFLTSFAHPNGRARFHAVAHRPAAEEPDAEYPVLLTTGRMLLHYQSGTQTRRVAALTEGGGDPYLELHPALAAQHSLSDGQWVRVLSRRGDTLLRARLTNSLRSDTVFAPFHWGGDHCINDLTNPALDPTSKMPEFKICAVRLENPAMLGSQP